MLRCFASEHNLSTDDQTQSTNTALVHCCVAFSFPSVCDAMHNRRQMLRCNYPFDLQT